MTSIDLFHEAVGFDTIADIYAMMKATPQHTYQVVTKRADRMHEAMRHPLIGDVSSYPLPNVWLGVSVENQEMADRRIPVLLETPTAVRFVSAEPLLGPVDLSPFLEGLDWLICGGESGPKARPCELRWIGSIVDQCAVAGVPCFVKQLGGRAMHTSRYDGTLNPVLLTDRNGGNPAEWPPELQVREWPS